MLRFTNYEVLKHMAIVKKAILKEIRTETLRYKAESSLAPLPWIGECGEANFGPSPLERGWG